MEWISMNLAVNYYYHWSDQIDRLLVACNSLEHKVEQLTERVHILEQFRQSDVKRLDSQSTYDLFHDSSECRVL